MSHSPRHPWKFPFFPEEGGVAYLQQLIAEQQAESRRRSKRARPFAYSAAMAHRTSRATNAMVCLLSIIERSLLIRLLDAPDTFVSLEELVSLLGAFYERFDRNRLMNAISHLRKKVRQRLGYALPLQGRHGYGYCFGLLEVSGSSLQPAQSRQGGGFSRADDEMIQYAHFDKLERFAQALRDGAIVY